MLGKFLFLCADLQSCRCWVGVLCVLVSVVLFSSYEYLEVLFCLVGNSSGILITDHWQFPVCVSSYLKLIEMEMGLEREADRTHRKRAEGKRGIPLRSA